MRRFFFLIIFFVFSLFTIYYLLSPTICAGRKLCLFTREAVAAGEFTISYNNLYQVDTSFNLNVKQNVKITNLTTQYYVSEFTISIGNVKVESVSASDETGSILANVNFSNNQTTIKLTFDTPVVGKGKSRNFALSYKAPELINKAGQILEVSIPKLANGADIDKFDVTLLVPPGAGPAAFISPDPKIAQASGFGGGYSYLFGKEQLTKSGITAAFGEKQVFSFTLTYHLFNKKSAQTEVALPADNAYQRVVISKIDPQPKDTRVDSDGNWLALYGVSAGQQKDVTVTGAVEVYPNPKFKSQPPLNLERYLQPAQYWEINDEYFTQKAVELKTPKQIYDFVTSFLSYNQERLKAETTQRIGAKTAVKDPKNAVCMEFTDLFITMARAAGIPTREVNGYAVSANERLRPLSLGNLGADILHAWPEYWDAKENVWVQVDPTWGTTSGGLDYFSKMDFNHIAFVHKGLSSTYPVPAGGYKTSPNQSGDVKVEFAQSLPQTSFEPKLSIEMSKTILSQFTTSGKIIVKNLSNQALSLGSLKIATEGLILKTPAEVDIGTLPPYAVREVELKVDSRGFLTSKKGFVKATLGPLEAFQTVQVRPSLFLILIIGIGGLILLTGVVFGSIFITRRFVLSQRPNPPRNPVSLD